jgi:uncharacterized glyoxalase superfamily protein PhnB
MSKVKPIPEGYHTITPFLVVAGAEKLIDFLKQAFGAKETFRTALPDGTIKHAEIKIGNSMLMMGDAKGECAPSKSMFYLYVEDTDALYQSALAAGATSIMPPSDQFYGDRSGGVKDPFGNEWWIATHIEDVSSEEMEKRAAAANKK